MVKRQKAYLGISTAPQQSTTWHRPLMGLLFAVAIMMLSVVLTGCCCSNTQDCVIVMGNYERSVSPKLIFRSVNDPAVDPQVFAYRSDWPSAEGEIEFGQITNYRRYWYNRSAASSNTYDHAYDQMRSYRYGTTIR